MHSFFPVSYLASRMTRIDERRPLKLHVGTLSEGDGVGRTRVESLIAAVVKNAFLGKNVQTSINKYNCRLENYKICTNLHAGRVPPAPQGATAVRPWSALRRFRR